MRFPMRTLILWIFAVTISTTAWASASTFQDPIPGELYNEDNQPELYCLAMNIYHEAKSEPIAGQYAVADVVINRMFDTRYPNTICEVVLQGPVRESWKTRKDPNLADDERQYYPVRHKCQFSWYCDGKKDSTRDNDAWRLAQEIAYRIAHEKKYRGITEGATHYHATYVSPTWARELTLVGRIGTHIFYRWSK